VLKETGERPPKRIRSSLDASNVNKSSEEPRPEKGGNTQVSGHTMNSTTAARPSHSNDSSRTSTYSTEDTEYRSRSRTLRPYIPIRERQNQRPEDVKSDEEYGEEDDEDMDEEEEKEEEDGEEGDESENGNEDDDDDEDDDREGMHLGARPVLVPSAIPGHSRPRAERQRQESRQQHQNNDSRLGDGGSESGGPEGLDEDDSPTRALAFTNRRRPASSTEHITKRVKGFRIDHN
jgi:hypothetical protein